MAVLAVEASLEAVSPVAALAAEAAEAGKSIIKNKSLRFTDLFSFPFSLLCKAAILMSRNSAYRPPAP